jgi:hypothetical protein
MLPFAWRNGVTGNCPGALYDTGKGPIVRRSRQAPGERVLERFCQVAFRGLSAKRAEG